MTASLVCSDGVIKQVVDIVKRHFDQNSGLRKQFTDMVHREELHKVFTETMASMDKRRAGGVSQQHSLTRPVQDPARASYWFQCSGVAVFTPIGSESLQRMVDLIRITSSKVL